MRSRKRFSSSRRRLAVKRYENAMAKHMLGDPKTEFRLARMRQRAYDLGATDHEIGLALAHAGYRASKRTRTRRRR